MHPHKGVMKMSDYEGAIVKSIKSFFTSNSINKKRRFAKLNRAVIERVIIVSLSVLIAVTAAVYFVGIPAISKLSETRAEVATLRTQQRDYAAAIENKTGYEEESMKKTAALNNAAAKFGTLMKDEKLDEYITGLLMKNHITTTSLDMTPTTPANIMPYSSDDDANAGDSAISVCTVTVKADGTLNDLYGLMGTAAKQPGVELASYAWNAAGSKVAGTEVTKSGLSLVFKIYMV
jgi:hypothetical protein